MAGLVIITLLCFCSLYWFVVHWIKLPSPQLPEEILRVIDCVHSRSLYWCGMSCKYAFWSEYGENKETLFHKICIGLIFISWWDLLIPLLWIFFLFLKVSLYIMAIHFCEFRFSSFVNQVSLYCNFMWFLMSHLMSVKHFQVETRQICVFCELFPLV